MQQLKMEEVMQVKALLHLSNDNNHAYGETVIESQPEKVVTISWGNQDVPLALGLYQWCVKGKLW